MFRGRPHRRRHARRFHWSFQCHYKCDAVRIDFHVGVLASVKLQHGSFVSLCRSIWSGQRWCSELRTTLHWTTLSRLSFRPVLWYLLLVCRCCVSLILLAFRLVNLPFLHQAGDLPFSDSANKLFKNTRLCPGWQHLTTITRPAGLCLNF